MEDELLIRSFSSSIPVPVLRAVYLREFTECAKFDTATALGRVDAFIVYALTRDTKYSQDRDLVPSAPARVF